MALPLETGEAPVAAHPPTAACRWDTCLLFLLLLETSITIRGTLAFAVSEQEMEVRCQQR